MDNSLVPFDLDNAEFRELGRDLVELMLQAVSAEREEPVLRSISGPESRALFDEPGKRVFLGKRCRLLPEKE